MNSVLLPLHTIIQLNTRLFKNCLVDVTDTVATRIISEGVNTMIFIAVHVFDARIFMADTAGTILPHPYPEIAAANRVRDIAAYPSLGDLIIQWDRLATGLVGCLESLSDEQLRAPSTRRFPIRDESLLGALSFLVQHESYHIGQLSLLRRIHGLGAMPYAENS